MERFAVAANIQFGQIVVINEFERGVMRHAVFVNGSVGGVAHIFQEILSELNLLKMLRVTIHVLMIP